MTQMPPQSFNQAMKPHRGTLILVLGILGIVLCFICGIVAWMMGGKDLQEMQNGSMDPSGMGITKAGRICGLIGAILGLLWLGFVILTFVIGGAAAAAGAGGP